MRPIKRVAITGGAGFIGSHLVDASLDRGFEVAVIDDLSVGRLEFIAEHVRAGRVRFVEGDILDLPTLKLALEEADAVFHLAANPDARRGLENPRIDLELDVLTTFQVLETMRLLGIPRVIFASSGTVYGDVGTAEVDERYGPCRPVSLYGAGKAAAEAFLSAYSVSFGLEAVVCRLGNVIGERATHGALFDFDEKLRRDSARLEILGNGQQAKPYTYVRDLVDALIFVALHAGERFDTFNVAPRGATSIAFLARTLLEELGLSQTPLLFGESPAGWPGDIPQSRMNADKLARLGWSPRYSSDEAVKVGVREFVRHTRLEATRAR